MWNKQIIDDLPLERLENNTSVAYALDAELHIAYCNPAWDGFAAENGGIGLERERQVGRFVLDVVARSLVPFYEHRYRDCQLFRHTLTHEYEGSSALTFRKFQMTFEPLPLSGGILILNRLLEAHEHERPPHEANDERYVAPAGSVFMCAHCRHTRHVIEGSWEWVPEYVERLPAGVTHTLCQSCAKYHYGDFL